MPQPESRILQEIRLAVSRTGARLFRNNVARGWIGKHQIYRVTATVRVNPGDVVIRKARRLHTGLAVGSSDLIGWVPVTITEDMLGQELAAFVSVEVKTKTGRVSTDQQTWLNAVDQAGGVAGVVRSAEEAVGLLGGLRQNVTE